MGDQKLGEKVVILKSNIPKTTWSIVTKQILLVSE